jgi:ATPase subunit of ABC transporter with duplicated ATPase domains
LLVVSHDRSFLNTVVTDVVYFDRAVLKLKVYKGDVTNFEAVRDDEKLRQLRQRELQVRNSNKRLERVIFFVNRTCLHFSSRAWCLQEDKRAHLQKFIDGPAATAKAAKQRKSKMKKLDRIGVEVGSTNDGKKWKASDQTEGPEEVCDDATPHTNAN